MRIKRKRDIRISDRVKVSFISLMIIVGDADEQRHSEKNGDSNDIDYDSDQADRIRAMKKGA